MKSARAAKPMTEAIERVSERNRGVNRSVLGFSAMRMGEVHIADVSKLPVEPGTIAIENEEGANLFLLGYSQVGGPDVMG